MRKLLDRLKKPFDRPASAETSRVTIVASALAAATVFGALLFVIAVGPRGVPGLSYYYVNAQFQDVAQITPGSEVRLLGRRVGQVSKAELRKGRPTLELQLLPGEGPVRSDTRARIRLKGILGGRFVELVPGLRGRPLPTQATLPMKQNSTRVELLDVLQTLDPPRRARFRSTVQGLGQGFLGRGEDVNRTLATAPRLFRDLDQISSAVLRRDGAARRFFPSAERLARAYDPVREDLARGFRPQAKTFGAFADRRRQLQDTLEEAPSTLAALRGGLDASVPLLNETAGLARATTRLTRPAPAAFRDASILLREARPALRETRPLLRETEEAVSPTLFLLRRIDPVIDPTIRALSDSERPLREFARRGCDYLTFGRNWRSGLGFGVPAKGRDPAGGLDNTYPGVGNVLNSFRVRAKAPTEFEELLTDNPPEDEPGREENAYPEPCEADEERLRRPPGTGPVPVETESQRREPGNEGRRRPARTEKSR